SPNGLLRLRACWMMSRYHDIDYTDPQILIQAIHAVLTCLTDPCLPVQVEAAMSLRELALLKGVEPLFIPHLPQLVEHYFRLLTEVGSDEVVHALDCLIDRYADYIAPLAARMASQFRALFAQYASESEQDEDKALAASQCLDALNTLVQAAKDNKEVLSQMEADIVPVLATVLNET
ncbi:hypothetical protein VYU27_010500, partial [Nannochloropsis oceanica]